MSGSLASQLRVDPSMSVSRNVTLPVGTAIAAVWPRSPRRESGYDTRFSNQWWAYGSALNASTSRKPLLR